MGCLSYWRGCNPCPLLLIHKCQDENFYLQQSSNQALVLKLLKLALYFHKLILRDISPFYFYFYEYIYIYIYKEREREREREREIYYSNKRKKNSIKKEAKSKYLRNFRFLSAYVI